LLRVPGILSRPLTPGDVSESNNEDSVSDSGTVVNGQSKRSSVVEPPNQALADLQLNQNKSKKPPEAETPLNIAGMADTLTQVCTTDKAMAASGQYLPVSEDGAGSHGSEGSKVSSITQMRSQLVLQKEILQDQEQLDQEGTPIEKESERSGTSIEEQSC
jgi:hypothetical protein